MRFPNNSQLRADAAAAVRCAPEQKKLVLVWAGTSVAVSLLVSIVNFLLEGQISGTGGLSGIGLRSILSTAQSVLSIASAILIPFWDLEFKEEDGEETDSSAAAIAVCGMLELLQYLPEGEDKTIFKNAIDRTMQSLYDNYSTKDTPEANGLLLHAVYSKPDKVGIDEMNIWGCYFYLEALKRMKDGWNLYW